MRQTKAFTAAGVNTLREHSSSRRAGKRAVHCRADYIFRQGLEGDKGTIQKLILREKCALVADHHARAMLTRLVATVMSHRRNCSGMMRRCSAMCT